MTIICSPLAFVSFSGQFDELSPLSVTQPAFKRSFINITVAFDQFALAVELVVVKGTAVYCPIGGHKGAPLSLHRITHERPRIFAAVPPPIDDRAAAMFLPVHPIAIV